MLTESMPCPAWFPLSMPPRSCACHCPAQCTPLTEGLLQDHLWIGVVAGECRAAAGLQTLQQTVQRAVAGRIPATPGQHVLQGAYATARQGCICLAEIGRAHV